MFGIAPTGSGKTAAFLIPLIQLTNYRKTKIYLKFSNDINNSNKHTNDKTNITINKCTPLALIVTPTRELARQIKNECDLLSKNLGLKIVLSESLVDVGNKSKVVDVVIATPFVMVKAIRSEIVDLSKLKCLVLDEADRLLDTVNSKIGVKKGGEKGCKNSSKIGCENSGKIGSKNGSKIGSKNGSKIGKVGVIEKVKNRETVAEQIDLILAACSSKRLQRCLFNATLPMHVEQLARTVLRDPVRLTVGMRFKIINL